LYEYIDSGNLCLIEWPEMIKGVLSNENVVYIHLSYNDDIDTRTIYVSKKLQHHA
jgi:tRNA A37 threonylcarbamoyladenosine biosynthesis protein TsaE